MCDQPQLTCMYTLVMVSENKSLVYLQLQRIFIESFTHTLLLSGPTVSTGLSNMLYEIWSYVPQKNPQVGESSITEPQIGGWFPVQSHFVNMLLQKFLIQKFREIFVIAWFNSLYSIFAIF